MDDLEGKDRLRIRLAELVVDHGDELVYAWRRGQAT
jgi:hypothetical protein